MMGDRLGVRWSMPVAPTDVHAGGTQATAAVAGRDLEDMFRADVPNAAALSMAWPADGERSCFGRGFIHFEL